MSLLELAPGLYPDIPEATYHQKELGIASKHALDELAKAPAAYWEWFTGPEPEDRDVLRLGRAAHAAILEPERFAATYIIAPDFGPLRKQDGCSSEEAKANKERKVAWYAEHAGATVLESANGKATLGMVRAIAEHPRASMLLAGGMPETTALWIDRGTGVRCKARLDDYREDLATIVDVKTTTDARPEFFRRTAESCTYYRQAAFYLSGLEALGCGADAFAFIAVEKAPPHLLRVYELDEADLKRGREEVRDLLDLYAYCLGTGVWPGYPTAIERLRLRPWLRGAYDQ